MLAGEVIHTTGAQIDIIFEIGAMPPDLQLYPPLTRISQAGSSSVFIWISGHCKNTVQQVCLCIQKYACDELRAPPFSDEIALNAFLLSQKVSRTVAQMSLRPLNF